MKDVKYWEHVILSGSQIEPRTKDEEANYEIAEFLVSQKKEVAA